MMKSSALGDCFAASWKNAFGALLSRPVLVLGLFLIILALSYANSLLPAAPVTVPAGVGAAHAGANALHGGLHSLARQDPVRSLLNLMQTVTMSVLAVYVIRYCLLGADQSGRLPALARCALRYMWLSMGLGCIVFAPMLVAAVVAAGVAVVAIRLAGLHGTVVTDVLIALAVLFLAGMVYLFLRVSLVLCHTALGKRPLIRDTWADTRGHVWTMVLSHLVTIAPMLGLLFLGSLVKTLLARQFPAAAVGYGWTFALAVYAVITTSAGAACSARMYECFAARMLQSETPAGVTAAPPAADRTKSGRLALAVSDATNLIWASVMLDAAKLVVRMIDAPTARAAHSSGLVPFTLGTLITAFLVLRIRAGQNWARVTLLTLFVLTLAPFLLTIHRGLAQTPYLEIIAIIQHGLYAYAFVLLFRKPASDFFRS